MQAKVLTQDSIGRIGRFAQQFGGWIYGGSSTSLTCSKVIPPGKIVVHVTYNNDSVYNPRTGGFTANYKPVASIEIVGDVKHLDLTAADSLAQVLIEAKKILGKMVDRRSSQRY